MPITPRPGGGGGATIPATTDLIAGDGAGNGADSGIVPAAVMLKSVYDPLNVSKISGGGGAGGTLSMQSLGASFAAGSVITDANNNSSGGSISTVGGAGSGNGGSVNTAGIGSNNGGNIDTSGGGNISTSAGGNIDTSAGGGDISTNGNGSVGLGTSSGRVTLIGSGSVCTVTLPGNTGTLALVSQVPALIFTGSQVGSNLGGTGAGQTAGISFSSGLILGTDSVMWSMDLPFSATALGNMALSSIRIIDGEVDLNFVNTDPVNPSATVTSNFTIKVWRL